MNSSNCFSYTTVFLSEVVLSQSFFLAGYGFLCQGFGVWGGGGGVGEQSVGGHFMLPAPHLSFSYVKY